MNNDSCLSHWHWLCILSLKFLFYFFSLKCFLLLLHRLTVSFGFSSWFFFFTKILITYLYPFHKLFILLLSWRVCTFCYSLHFFRGDNYITYLHQQNLTTLKQVQNYLDVVVCAIFGVSASWMKRVNETNVTNSNEQKWNTT